VTAGGDPPPVAVVTGAAGALGRAIAREFRRRGALLVLVARDEAGLENLQGSLGPEGGCLALVADITRDGAGHQVTGAALGTFGRLDVLVNNAGTEGPIGPLEDVAMEAVLRTYQLNVFAPLRLMQACIVPFRAQGGGRVVNMASGAGLVGTANMAVYSSSKHALVGLTRSVAAELAGSGIAVNAVCPGCVESPMMTRIESDLALQTGASESTFVSGIPAARFAAPGEVANLAAYLAFDAPAYMTGTTLVIDGAMRA
jgi:NAD(P)-dependent dehydrogenase (short-subunit alcohol dehydrogenase family)